MCNLNHWKVNVNSQSQLLSVNFKKRKLALNCFHDKDGKWEINFNVSPSPLNRRFGELWLGDSLTRAWQFLYLVLNPRVLSWEARQRSRCETIETFPFDTRAGGMQTAESEFYYWVEVRSEYQQLKLRLRISPFSIAVQWFNKDLCFRLCPMLSRRL